MEDGLFFIPHAEAFDDLKGLIYGAYVDGANAGQLILYAAVVLGILAFWIVGPRGVSKPQPIQKAV